MEFLFIWFKEHFLFDRQGFQLSGEFRFDYDMENGTLAVSRNPLYVDGFYRLGNDSRQAVITNITAVIGRNGAGKSTFLNFIKKYLVPAQGLDFKDALVVYRHGEEHVVLYDGKDLEVNVVKEDAAIPDFMIRKNSEPKPYRSDTSFIFFSNILDLSAEENLNDYYNLSTNYLIKGDKRNRVERHFDHGDQSEIDVHRIEEINRQVIFVHDYETKFKDKLSIRIPSELQIVPIESDDPKNMMLGPYEEIYRQIMYRLIDSKTRTRQRLDKSNATDNYILSTMRKNLFYDRVYTAVVKSFFKDLALYTNHPVVDSKELADAFNQHPDADVLDSIDHMFNMLRRRSQRYENDRIYRWVSAILDVLELIHKYVESRPSWTDPVVSIPVQSDSLENSDSYVFVQKYRDSFHAYPYLDFDWNGLSTGEKSFLNMFSRLYTRSDSQVFGSNEKLADHVVLLIDEGELYFHPEWQRQFVYNLIRFLGVAYGRQRGPQRKIQVILTSHSPFILSDMPNYNVNYVSGGDGGSIVTTGLEEDRQTFAANIHTLFMDSFYMENGTIGEVARIKIDHLLRDLFKSKNVKPEDRKRMKKTIDLIGEVVIRRKLIEIYEEKFGREDGHD